MLKSHESFHSANGRRLILVADDKHINRELLRDMLREDYGLAFAEDGEQALELMRQNRDALSLVLLDLMMPEADAVQVLKAVQADGGLKSIPIIGIRNVDEQIRREQEYARALRMANQDALTGVKSAHAYAADERKINQAIESGVQQPFAVVVCDVNDLKGINDTKGHSAGDQYIKDACAIVCNVFKRSPVYRIGGDEFVAILRGSDFDDCERLMERLAAANDAHRDGSGVLVAVGLAVYEPGTDANLAAVFARADAAMYENKKGMKTHEGNDE